MKKATPSKADKNINIDKSTIQKFIKIYIEAVFWLCRGGEDNLKKLVRIQKLESQRKIQKAEEKQEMKQKTKNRDKEIYQ